MTTNYEGNPIRDTEAMVNVTYDNKNGDMAVPVSRDASDAEILRWVTEAVRTGGVRGLPADPTADFTDFVVDRTNPTTERPFALLMVRPKVPFGAMTVL